MQDTELNTTSPVLREVVRRIVQIARPNQIILFGSAATGKARPDSDLDLLVIKSGVQHRRHLAQEIHLSLFGLGVPVDIVVVTPEDVEALRSKPGTVVAVALREGKEVYAA